MPLAMSPEQLHPLSATYVVYQQGDLLGELLALISLTPIFIMVAYAVLLASRRDLHTASLLLGQLLNEALNYVLKHIIKEPRPSRASAEFLPEYGMPSNHAQFMGFWAGYLLLWAASGRWQVGAGWRCCAVLLLLAGTGAVGASRVYLHYHTVQQVLAGCCCGALAGLAWFAATEAALRPRFSAWAQLPWARWLLIRDCSHVNVLLAEYAAVQGKEQLGKGFAGAGGSRSSSSISSTSGSSSGSSSPFGSRNLDKSV